MHDVEMDFRPIERDPGSFQRTVSAEQIVAMCQRTFGEAIAVTAAVELGNGMYNNTYRVEIVPMGSVILRVAPEPCQQFRSERELMRVEYASLPYFAPIAPLIPPILGADFTHELVGRDYLFQSVLPGIPAPQALRAYDRSQWAGLFRQLGEITRKIHAVCGQGFGPLRGPLFRTWSEAFVCLLGELADDIDGAGLDSADLRQVITIAEKERAILDEVAEPRLLHGDLWTVNVMLADGADEPTVTGVFDNDRTLWGDPAADWTIQMAGKKPGTERDAFWDTYGAVPSTPEYQRRDLFYRVRHIAAIRLERHRLGNDDGVPETYEQMGDLFDALQR